MNLLKIKSLFLFTILFGQLCFADSGDEYWNAYEGQRKIKANYSLVEHVNNLFTSSNGLSLEAQEKQANAILYFISTGGKYGFRKAPATAEEIKTLSTALYFSGRIKKDRVDFVQTYETQHGTLARSAEINTHLDVAQKLFNEANKPLFVFFHPTNAQDAFANFYHGLIQEEAKGGRKQWVDGFYKSDRLTINTAETDAWWNNQEFKSIITRLLPASNPHAAAGALLQGTHDIFDRGVQLLEEASGVKQTVSAILKKINFRHPSKVAFIGYRSFVASLAANYVSREYNISLGGLFLHKTPILWSSRNTLLPRLTVMSKPDLKGAGDAYGAFRHVLAGTLGLQDFSELSYDHVQYLVNSLEKSASKPELRRVESSLATVFSVDSEFYLECMMALLEVLPEVNPII